MSRRFEEESRSKLESRSRLYLCHLKSRFQIYVFTSDPVTFYNLFIQTFPAKTITFKKISSYNSWN